MGGMQAVAMFPGVSRSGSTLVGGLFRGWIEIWPCAFFLMSIPAILGSVVFKFKDMITQGPGDVSTLPLSSACWFRFVGLMSIRFMLRLVRNHKLYGFAIYVACMGVFCPGMPAVRRTFPTLVWLNKRHLYRCLFLYISSKPAKISAKIPLHICCRPALPSVYSNTFSPCLPKR